jgi:hypothetical protein
MHKQGGATGVMSHHHLHNTRWCGEVEHNRIVESSLLFRMCMTEVCSKCKQVINIHHCADRNKKDHIVEMSGVTCSGCIQKVYVKRERVEKVIRSVFW